MITWSRHSQRSDPISRSTYAFCHGERAAVNFVNVHRLRRRGPRMERGVAIANKIARRVVPGERLAELLRRPRRSRMIGDADVHVAPTLMRQNHENEQQAARRRWHDEEVRRHDLADVIPQECPPWL